MDMWPPDMLIFLKTLEAILAKASSSLNRFNHIILMGGAWGRGGKTRNSFVSWLESCHGWTNYKSSQSALLKAALF